MAMSPNDDNSREVLFHIRRFDPERDAQPRWQDYSIRVQPGMTVLDGLHLIQETLDATLTWRYSCRMGICGSCAMLINGRPRLACNTQIFDVGGDRLVVAPMPNYAVIKDLVPDLTPLFEKHHSVQPYTQGKGVDGNTGEFIQTPEELERYLQFTYCIRCGLCLAACPTVASDRSFLGPMPLAQAHRYNNDSRDQGFSERTKIVGASAGAFRCHYAGECSNVCPKGVDPARAVQLLKRDLVFSYLRLLKRKPCAELSEGPPPDAKRRPDIPQAPPFTVE
jgi:succinate dehydrogenase / fumarate reductase iron-sulfur subunit